MPKLDYVVRDYEGYRDLMISKIPDVLPEWTDRSQSDFGVALLELLAYGLDTLAYYQDRAVRERILEYAQQRKSVIELCRFLTYEMQSQQPSQYLQRFTKTADALNTQVVIPRGYKVGTKPDDEEQLIFETTEDLIIPAGQAYGDVTVIQGLTVANELVGASTGAASQVYKLAYPDALKDSLLLYISTTTGSERWMQVTDFLTSTSTDKHYKSFYNELNELYVEFGNGNSGAIPPLQSIIDVTYRVGGGDHTNVGTGTIIEFVDNVLTGLESTNNPSEPTVYGRGVETLDEARVNAPKHFKARERAVTPDDFQYFAKQHAEVSKARVVETFNVNNEVDVYVANNAFTAPTQGMKDSVLALLEERTLANVKPVVKALTLTPIAITVAVEAYEGYLNSDIKTLVTDMITSKFASSVLVEGEPFSSAIVYKEIMPISGVRFATVTAPAGKLTPAASEIYTLGTVTVTVTGGDGADA